MIKDRRQRRKLKIRKKIHGDKNFPRLTIYKSLKSIYVQAIDDESSTTLCSASIKGKKNQGAATELADQIAIKLKDSKITKAKFDRNGYHFGATLHAFIEGLRKNQIEI